MRPKLKIGLLLDDTSVPYWASRTLERIIRSEFAEIVLLVVDEGTEKGLEPRYARDSFLYNTLKWFDRTINKSGCDPLAHEDLPTGLDKASIVYLKHTKGALQTISEEAVRDIKERNLDVLIDIGNVTPMDDISHCSQYGVLSFSLGDGEGYDRAYPGVWEIFDGVPVTGSHVRRIYNGNVSIIYRSYSHTVSRSEKRNREQIYYKGISFLPRVLEALYYRGEDAIASNKYVHLTAWGQLARPGPSNMDMMSYFLRQIPKNTGFLTKRMLFEERWAIRYKFGEGIPTSFDDFVTLVPPRHTWWADPHAAQLDDDYYIFIEELVMPRSRNRAHISVIKVDGQGMNEAPVKVLGRPYHLSYPFVLQWKGSHYMIPESSNARTIELYEAIEFPYKWQHVKDLITEVSAVDTTMVRRNGLWWMFCNIKENEGAPINDELFLFYSDDLLTDHWKPHPQNPIISDARSARPAGAIFEQDGILYRPSQDCSKYYGYAVNINKIAELDERRYKEIRKAYIEPKLFRNASRVHTFSRIPGLTVVDTFMARLRLV